MQRMYSIALTTTTVDVVVPVLGNALYDANEAIRSEAAQALGEIGKPAQAAGPCVDTDAE